MVVVVNAIRLDESFLQVGSLEGVYHFIHEDSPSRERRSASILHPKHHDLLAEEHVRMYNLFGCHSNCLSILNFDWSYSITQHLYIYSVVPGTV